MLQLMHLRKRYTDRQVLEDASLVVERGEAVALLGSNGSGKTTLLRCIAGLQRPDSGRVVLGDCDALAEPRVARARMSYLAQRTEFPPTLTVREILRVVASLRRVEAVSIEREITRCGLEKLSARTVSRLSGGERQRVALAALLIPKVDLYLLDEPTANLDAEGVSVLMERVGELRRDGSAVLFTTHIGSDLDCLATRALVLREGRVEPAGQKVPEEDPYANVEYLDLVDRPERRVRREHAWARTTAARSRQLRQVRHADLQ